MKIFLVLLLFFTPLFGIEKPTESFGKIAVPSLLTVDRTPSPALLELLETCGITHDGSLKDIVEKTQKVWRQQGKERWEMSPIAGVNKERIFALLDEMHVLAEIPAPTQKFDYAIVHGALLSRVRMRFAFLIKQWERGVRFNKIVFLSGSRPLSPTLESLAELLERENRYLPISSTWIFNGTFPKTEAEMTRFVYEQADIPQEMKSIPVVWVNAPLVVKEGVTQRPNTQDTVEEWLKTHPKPGSCIAVSNQPYIGYQNSVLTNFLPSGFTLITIGPQSEPSTKLEVHLDNLARWLSNLAE